MKLRMKIMLEIYFSDDTIFKYFKYSRLGELGSRPMELETYSLNNSFSIDQLTTSMKAHL